MLFAGGFLNFFIVVGFCLFFLFFLGGVWGLGFASVFKADWGFF